MRSRRHAGFTLFEVMISLLVLTTAILTTVSLLPIGLRQQQLARSQVFAAATAVSLMYNFHNPVASFEGISRLAPLYNGVPGTDTTNTVQVPYSGWAENLRSVSVHSQPYQANAEQELSGWFSGVLPLPTQIAARLDSDNDEIQSILDQGGQIFFPDPNFLQGLNQGAVMEKTMQVLPAPELQKLVFAFTGYPQQNALSSFPVDSYPYYETYPFPPSWLSVQATGLETRILSYIPYGVVGNSRGGNGYGSRTGISAAGRTTSDWSWEGGLLCMDDAGHAQYYPVQWGTPMRPGQDTPAWCSNKALDDPDSSDEYTKCDAGTAMYEGNGNYQGRNWRYFATRMTGVPAAQNLWMVGNGQAPLWDPYYSGAASNSTDPATGQPWSQEWAWFCFQRLTGVDAAYVSYPANSYANASQLNNSTIPAITVSTVTTDTNSPGGSWDPSVTVNVPSKTFASHAPASFYRAGWLPIRGLLTNPNEVNYEGMGNDPANWNTSAGGQVWAPEGWQDNDTHVWGDQVKAADVNSHRMWNVVQAAGFPKTSLPQATYEMRANYRDRALDLWQAVMPTHSNLAQLTKNPDPTTYSNPFYPGGVPGESNALSNNYYASLVEESVGGTMVDCCKYEYPPTELDRFQFLAPQDIAAADWPIKPAQVLALSYLAHAAMMVTGYGPPFGITVPQAGQNNQEVMKLSWEGLNWTYLATPEEEEQNESSTAGAYPPYPQLPQMYAYLNNNNSATGYTAAWQTRWTPNNSTVTWAYNTSTTTNNIYGGQGIVKDALVCAADVLNPYANPAQTPTGNQILQNVSDSSTWYIDVCNPTAYDWVVYPGDEIVLEPSYYQWFYRWDRPSRGYSWWGDADPHDVMPFPDMGWNPWNYYFSYDEDNSSNAGFPNLNYKMQTFRVLQVEPITLNPMSTLQPNVLSGTQYSYVTGPAQTAPGNAPSGPTTANIPPAVHPGGAPQWVGGYMSYPQPMPYDQQGEMIGWSSPSVPSPYWNYPNGGTSTRNTLTFKPGLKGLRLWLNAPVPSYPLYPDDAHTHPGTPANGAYPPGGGWWGAPGPGTAPGNVAVQAPFPNVAGANVSTNAWVDPISLHAGVIIRRISSPTDKAFARKVYEMCMQWAAAYAAENPNDFGAPRMTNHPLMMDQPLAIFDLFYDAGNGGGNGQAIRSPLNYQTSDGSAAAETTRRQESFYRWMVPTNNAPSSWFYGGAPTDTGTHDNSHLAPGPARYDYFDQMVHNNQLVAPGSPNSAYDDAHFWLTKRFSPFVRTRTLKFWSVDWKSYQDAEMVPSAPVDFAKHNRFPRYDSTLLTYSAISPNGDYGYGTGDLGDGHNPLCGNPESFYVWTDATRAMRYGDLVGGELAGYLYQNWNCGPGTAGFNTPMAYNPEPTTPTGGHITADVHLGHWGADRNGNGKLDIGPVPPSTRMRAVTVGEYLYYDPVLRLNLSN